MQPYIDEAKSSMRNVVDEITTRYGDNAALRLAVMAYRDIEDVKPREVLDFTSSVDKCTRFIAKLRACTTTAPVPEDCKDNKSWKADWPEDLTGAMKDSTNLRWRSKTRCAIVITGGRGRHAASFLHPPLAHTHGHKHGHKHAHCALPPSFVSPQCISSPQLARTDAPCHGKEFYSMANWGRADRDAANAGTSTDGWVRNGAVIEGSTGTIKADEVDNHPNGDPRGLDPRRVVLDLRRCNVDLHFFRVYYHVSVWVTAVTPLPPAFSESWSVARANVRHHTPYAPPLSPRRHARAPVHLTSSDRRHGRAARGCIRQAGARVPRWVQIQAPRPRDGLRHELVRG